jgi:hypothetical protein
MQQGRWLARRSVGPARQAVLAVVRRQHDGRPRLQEERLAPWLEHLLHDKPAHHARLIRPFAHWFVLRRARRTAARRTFTRGSADFARARVLAALDLLSWLDQRGLDLRDLTQADLDRWLTGGATTRRAVRYFLQWAPGRSLVGDLDVPFPPRQEPERLLAESGHIQQLDRCLTDDAMPLDLRVGERSSCSSGCWSAGSPS